MTNLSLPDSSARLAESSTTPVSQFPGFLLVLGVGGLATLALTIGVFTRTPKSPLAEVDKTILSSPNPSVPSSTTTNLHKKSSSSAAPPNTPMPSNREGCSVVVSGNLRSEPTPFRENVVQAVFRKQLPVTGKQTKGGWMEVKLPNNTLAWVHRNVALDEEEIDSCLFSKGVTIQIVPDIIPPEPSPSP